MFQSSCLKGWDVHVVTLSRCVCLAAILHVRERTAAREKCTTVGVFHGLLESAFGVVGRVRQGEDDGLVIHLAHSRQDVLVECTADGRQAHEDGWLDELDDFGKALDLFTFVVVAREVHFMICEFVASVIGNESLDKL